MNGSETYNIQWTEHGIPIRNLWYMLLYAWNEVPVTRVGDLEDIENSPTLDALLASMLARLVQQRFRIGLGRDYMEENHLIDGIRGRINFTNSLKHRSFDHGRAYCDFQQYSINTLKNQIIRSTLMRLVQLGKFGPDKKLADALRHKLRLLTRLLDGVELIELKPNVIHRQQSGRNDRDYRLMLAICDLLLQRQMPADSKGGHALPGIDRESLLLYDIYERFVANFYIMRLGGWTVSRQKHLHWHEKSFNQHMPIMKPDLVLEEKSTGKMIVLDTKFTANSLIKNQWGSEVYDSSHLYQLYTYLKTQEHLSERHKNASGILLYPAVYRNFLSEKIELQDKVLSVECVDLTTEWQAIEKRLLGIILTIDSSI